MITLKNITKTYGGAAQVQALKGINLTIDDGEIFGIIGKSGAGKSTLVRCINMLEKPTSGQVIIDDKDLTKMNESQLRAERKNIGMIFQHFNLLSSRTVAENIAFPLELVGASKDVIEKKVAYVPGGAFYPNGGHANHFRLNYSNMPEDRIVEGIKRLADVLKEELAK